MNDKQRIVELEAVLDQFLQPIRNIPFSLIVKSMSGHVLIPMERSNHLDVKLTAKLVQVAILTAELVRKKPIRRNRPNEVGNDIEPFVMQAAIQLGMSAERPRTASGKLKRLDIRISCFMKLAIDRPISNAKYLAKARP